MNRPSPDDMNDIIMSELREENKKLKKEVNFYYKAAKQFRKDKDVLMKENEELEKENKELKEKLDKLRTDNIYEE